MADADEIIHFAERVAHHFKPQRQCVEKYMKARLTEAGIEFPKTHDLTLLLNLALAVEPGWAKVSRELIALTY